LPRVVHSPVLRRELAAPREGRALQAAARRELPLGLGRERLAGPSRERLGILRGHLGDGMARPSLEVAVGPLRPRPAGAGDPAPPVAVVVEPHGTGGFLETSAAADA